MFENGKDRDKGVNLLLFAICESVQESLGFSPFELVFGHSVRGPLKLLKERWLNDDTKGLNLLEYVSTFRNRLRNACELARTNLKAGQSKMKRIYDQKAQRRVFDPGDKVLVLLPTMGNSLKARYHGPYKIVKRVSDINYIVETPDRRKAVQLCHINMLKSYYDRKAERKVMTVQNSEFGKYGVKQGDNMYVEDSDVKGEHKMKLTNSQVLANLDVKLGHLPVEKRNDLIKLIHENAKIFPDVPNKTDSFFHDVDVGGASPIKQHPYRVGPVKLGKIRSEVQYMLDNNIIEPSQSEWASPCVLVSKPDGSVRFCTDYRKVNSVTKTDSYPIPRIDDCIDRIGNAKWITKIDLLKGYWGVPLTKRAKEISAFVTPDGLYQYTVTPFGMKNSGATFQRMMNACLRGLINVVVYIDDIIIYSHDWEDHLTSLANVFARLRHANLTVNLHKSEFGKAKVVYLGYVVGGGQIAPVEAKIKCIVEYPAPENRRSLMRFLGMAGYYRKFCRNFSDVTVPLTDLLKKGKKFVWSDACQESFERVKSLLCTVPVLKAPNFDKPFMVSVDASDLGAGAVLLQVGSDGVDHPVAYFSKKFNNCQRNYSTVEKEALALVLAIQHFEIYVSSSPQPVVVFTDHNPLVFLNRMKNKNRRLLGWSLYLQEYNLDIKYVRGVDNVCADALSRALSAE